MNGAEIMSTMSIAQTNIATAADGQSSIDAIRHALRNEIAAILRGSLPSLALVPQDKVYDRVMGEPTLLAQSLRLFRSQPDLFAAAVVPSGGSFPQAETDMLRCGRSLAEAISLVVRACARRYFRTRLPMPKPRQAPRAKVSGWRSLLIGLGLAQPQSAPQSVRQPSPGDRLFQAMRAFLRFEWQVPLIPVYAVMPLEVITSLGEKLLDYRDPQKLQILAEHRSGRDFAATDQVPLLLEPASCLFHGPNDELDAETLWQVAQSMRLLALFPNIDVTGLRRMVAQIAATNPKVLQSLRPALGNDIRHFTLYLFVTLDYFGPGRYRQVMGGDVQGWVISGMTQRISSESPLSGTNEEMRIRIVGWLSQTLKAIQEDEARAAAASPQAGAKNGKK